MTSSASSGSRERVHELRRRDDREPAQHEVQREPEAMPALEAQDRDEDTDGGAAPGEYEQRDAPGWSQRQQGDRCVAAGDEHEDHGVVEVLHQPVGADRPSASVVGGAHAVEPGQGRGEDPGTHPGGGGTGERHERDPGRDRDEEGNLMKAAPQLRLVQARPVHLRTITSRFSVLGIAALPEVDTTWPAPGASELSADRPVSWSPARPARRGAPRGRCRARSRPSP